MTKKLNNFNYTTKQSIWVIENVFYLEDFYQSFNIFVKISAKFTKKQSLEENLDFKGRKGGNGAKIQTFQKHFRLSRQN